MDRKPIHFRTDQQGLDVDPTNGAIIKGRDGYTPLTFKNQIDHTYILSPTGDVIFAQPGQENVVVPGNMAVEIPANSLGTFNYSNSDKMNTMQYAQEGGASSDQQQKIISMVAQGLQQGADPKQIMQELVKMGMSVEQAQGLVTAVAKELQASQEEQVSQEDEQDMMQQDQEQMGMAEMGGQPCIDCFDNYNPSPQAQNLNWYYKANGGTAYMMDDLYEAGGQSLPKAGLGNLGNFLGGFGNMGDSMMGMGNPINNPMYSDLYGKSDKEGMLMQQAMNGQIPINQLPANLQVQMQGALGAMKAGGEAFPQAQTYLPYDRAGETTPNFMFEMGGQSNIDELYQILKEGGMDHNPKKKKKGKFGSVNDFAKYVNGGSLPKAVDGINYNDPNYVYQDLSGQNRKIKFDNKFNEWYYEGDDGTAYNLPANESGYYDMYYSNNPGVAGSNRAGSTNPGNNQGGNNQGSGNSGGGSNPGGSNFSNPYASYVGGNAITQLLGSQAGAGLGLLGQALGAFGMGANPMGMMGLMGKPKFRGTYYNADGKKQRFRAKNAGALAAVPYYFGASGQGAGTNSGPNTNSGPGSNNNQGSGNNDSDQTSENNDQNSNSNNKNSNLQDRMNAMLADTNFNINAYRNQNKALRQYERGIKNENYRGKGWDYDQNIYNPKYADMMNDPNFDETRYHNLERAFRNYGKGINDTDYNPYKPWGNPNGRGWEASRMQKRQDALNEMYNADDDFNTGLYRNDDRAYKHWARGRGKGWNGYEFGGGIEKYAPGGDAHWTFSYRTPLSGMNNYMNTMAFQSGVMSGIKENDRKALYKNAQDNFNTVSTGMAYKGAANKAPTRNGTPSPVGTTNYMGMNAYTPGNQNFGYNNFPSAYLTQIGEAKMGGSILDDYEDGSEVDLSTLSPEEQDAFIQQIYAAGGSVEFI